MLACLLALVFCLLIRLEGIEPKVHYPRLPWRAKTEALARSDQMRSFTAARFNKTLVKVVRNRAFSRAGFSRTMAFILLTAIAYACSRAQSGPAGTGGQASAGSPASASATTRPGNVVAVGAASVITAHGQIVSVDQDKELVTLRADDGKQVTLHAYNPYNLAAAKPGERFVAKFYEIATIQKLAPGQSPPTPSLTEGIVSATPGQTPGAALGSQLQFAVTIDAIDKNDKAISIKGPDGVVEVVDVSNPEALDQVQVGEHIVVTLTDAVVVALNKEAANIANAAPVIDPLVRQVMDRTCTMISSAKTVTYHAEINFDSVLPSYVKLQYAAALDAAIKRPNRLAISYKSDLGAKEIWYNGKTLTILDLAHRAYASVAAPDTIDAMLSQAAEEKNLSIPMEGFDFNHPCARIYPDIQRGKYVGINDVGGVDCYHFAFSQQEADWQLWVDHGKKPLPLKIVITYKKLPSAPQWAAVLSKWSFNRKLSASLFEPKVPKGVIKTSFIGPQEKQQ